MERNSAYSLGLYEKAFPGGLGFPKMLEETRRLGFDRLEISVDETDGRLSRLHWSAGERQALVSAIRDSGTPIRTMCLSGHRKYPMGSHDPMVVERSMEIMEKALKQSHEGRMFILKHLTEVLPAPHKEISKYAPRIEKLFLKQLKMKI